MDDRLNNWEARLQEEDLREFSWRYLWGLLHDGRVWRDRSAPLLGAWAAGGELATIDEDDVLSVRAPDTGAVLSRFPLGQGDHSYHIDLDPGGRVAAVLTDKATLTLIDAATGKERWSRPVRGGHVRLSPDGRRVAVLNTAEETVHVWDAASGNSVGKIAAPGKDAAGVLALSPDGVTAAEAVAPARTHVALLTVATGKTRDLAKVHISLECLAFTPDGARLVGADMGGHVYVWDAATGAEERRFDVQFGIVTCLAVSADGKRVASGSQNGVVAVTDLDSGETSFRVKGHLDAVTFVAPSPDGKALASGGRDGRVRFWDPDRPPGGRLLHDGGGRVLGLACSPDGRWAAATQQNEVYPLRPARPGNSPRRWSAAARWGAWPSRRTARRWPSATTATRGPFVRRRDRRGPAHPGRPDRPGRRQIPERLGGRDLAGRQAPRHRPRGLTVNVGDYPQVARVWDLESGKVIRTLPHGNRVVSAAFSADGACWRPAAPTAWCGRGESPTGGRAAPGSRRTAFPAWRCRRTATGSPPAWPAVRFTSGTSPPANSSG